MVSRVGRASDSPAPAGTAPPEASATLRLKRAENALRQGLGPALDAEGLHIEHWQILAVLLARPGLRMSDLSEAAVLPPASLTRHVDKLVERALLIRRIDSHDKRSVVVGLSAMGRSVAEKLAAVERTCAVVLGMTDKSQRALSQTS